MLCQSCGFELGSNTPKFCPHCGSSVKASAEVPAQVSTATPGNRLAGNRRLFGSIGLFVAVVITALIKFGGGGGILPNSSVRTVRNGFLADYNTTTVGKAFEGTFQDGAWKSFETPKGETVVEFRATMRLSEVDKFGCSPACQKQLDKLHQECITSGHVTTDTAAMTKTDNERKEAYDRSRAELAAQRQEAKDKIAQVEVSRYTPSLLDSPNLPVYDRAGKPINYDTERAKRAQEETARSEGLRSLGIQLTALDDQTENLQRQYEAQHSSFQGQIAQLEQASEQATTKCVDARRGNLVTPLTVQFTLSADKQSFAITYTDLQLDLAAIYH